jgi:hypothetical protein
LFRQEQCLPLQPFPPSRIKIGTEDLKVGGCDLSSQVEVGCIKLSSR